mmetsp:Transcript_5000/g.8807  ORF Transcript_5000/g.8807 Transcript_5000/m.8807 type:complete len:88 (+) Transcript_5000:95-358(+)
MIFPQLVSSPGVCLLDLGLPPFLDDFLTRHPAFALRLRLIFQLSPLKPCMRLALGNLSSRLKNRSLPEKIFAGARFAPHMDNFLKTV